MAGSSRWRVSLLRTLCLDFENSGKGSLAGGQSQRAVWPPQMEPGVARRPSAVVHLSCRGPLACSRVVVTENRPLGHSPPASRYVSERVDAPGQRLAEPPSEARCKFFSLTETPEDYTIIVDEEGFLELPSSEHLSVADATWLALNVVSGGGSFSSSQPIGVTKIAKSVIAPLADQNISVFMLSTYQTDFILVRERDLPFVTHTLSTEFTILRVVNGETVAAEDLGITNGFVKPKMVQRPVIHPLTSPSNRFCVTSLDPDTLPTVATLLMDVMFYSNGMKDPMAAGDDGGHIRFFSFSLIEGYISLVMDVQTQQRFPSNLLFTSASGELWKMVRIGGQPLGFDECGIVAQISEPLAAADIPAYYISTFKFDHALVPEENITGVISALKVSQAEKH
ncbi:cytosolic arginine sensor for mTORC1 subunit 2 [Marmota monax]|uniref:cytosolic arginine sensor for mTORC1 subunit 2 n=1 Tax=Marmota monax TaxID=9995 RepID=UPI0026EACE57|nr:cytosolic arginine sensor for mTORC1 subunit 2 [Marmota monax]